MPPVLALVALAINARCQTSAVKYTPDCLFTATIDTAGTSTVAANGNGDNRSIGCNLWVAVWEVGGGGSPVVTIQSASTNGSSPGAWSTFGGSVSSGANPTTGAVGTIVLVGFQPWVRFRLQSGAGVLTGRLLGYRNPGGGSGGSSSSTGYGLPACFTAPQRAVVSVTGTGNTQIVGATAGQKINVCKLLFAGDVGSGLRLVEGTGTNCGTGTANISGVFANTTGFSFDFDGALQTQTGNALCLASSVASAIGGLIIYVKD